MACENRLPLLSSLGRGSLASRLTVTISMFASSMSACSSLGKIFSSSYMAPVPSRGLFRLPKSGRTSGNRALESSDSSGTIETHVHGGIGDQGALAA